MSDDVLCEAGADLLLQVLAVPRASKSALAGVHAGRLKVRVAAPPVDGAANSELVRFLAAALGVARSRVRLERGASSKRKSIRISDLGIEEARERLSLPPEPAP